MLRQMSGPPGVHVQSPVERAGRAVPVSVPPPPSPPSAPDPCVRTGPATTLPSAPVSAFFLLQRYGEKREKECDQENVRDTWSF